MTATDWNLRYQTITDRPLPCQVLLENAHLLPTTGTALDLACGLGANALLLARQGLETFAWDYAAVAIQKLREYVAQQTEGGQQTRFLLHPEVRDVITTPLPPATFDVIVICRFLERRLVSAIIDALKPNGLLFYQTFTRTYVSDGGPKNPEYRLADNELLLLFKELQIVVYREEGNIGDSQRGFRNEAMLIGRRATTTG
jgi:SAM-dependent methyltransferase